MSGLLVAPAVAHAQSSIAVRAAYYKERSTRVMQPMIDAKIELENASQIDAHFLVDAITSASAATGAGNTEFTELRYEAGVGYTRPLAKDFRLGISGRLSTEDDYQSVWAIVRGEWSLADKNTTLVLAVGRGFDAINNGVTTALGEIGTPARSESMNAGLTSFSVTQILGKALVGNLTYDFGDVHGYQANIYRVVFSDTLLVPERVPELRLRHAVYGGVRGIIVPSKTTYIVGYRFYADDWGIIGHTPQARVVQQLVPGLDVRASFRYHTQSAADFFQEVYSRADIINNPYVVNDEKLGALNTTTLGGQLVIDLAKLAESSRSGLFKARFDVTVEHIRQSTSFGNALVLQVGMAVPL